MITLLLVLIAGLSCWILVQDLSSRSIHLVLLIAVGICNSFFAVAVHRPLLDIGLNAAYLFLLFALLWITTKLVFRKSLEQMLGLGDVIYLGSCVPLFSFPSFLIWLNIGLIVSLMMHLVLMKLSDRYNRMQLIPLAGFLAIIFTFAIVFETYVSPITNLIYPA